MSDHFRVPPTRRPLRLAALLLVGLLAVLGWSTSWAPTAQAAPVATAAPVAGRAGASLHVHGHLAGDTARPAAGARRGSTTWQGSRITYYETIPAKWDWSLSGAVAKWNTTGASIRFVRTTDRSRADLTIAYGDTDGAAGIATVGATQHARVRLNPSYARVDALDAHNRVEVLGIFAHELGHVLGFSHTTARCSLMSPVLDVSGCGVVSDDHPGYYGCQTIDRALVARFVRLYGGQARYTTTPWCLIDPMPSALAVAFGGGETSPVTVSWRQPSFVPTGSRVEIQHWSDTTCATVPDWAQTDYSTPAAGSWQDVAPEDTVDNCFSAQLVNRYGVGRTSVRATVVRPAVAAAVVASDVPSDLAPDIAPEPVTTTPAGP